MKWFRRALRWCAVIHDLGKATDAFQKRLRKGNREPPHYVRHEVVSYWMACKHAGLARAIEESFANLGDWAVAQIPYLHAAVLGHHLKFPRDDSPVGYDESLVNILWPRLLSDGVWNLLCEVAGRDIPVSPNDVPPVIGDAEWLIDEVVSPYQRSLKDVPASPARKLASMLRGALIAVDILGSVLAQTQEQWEGWLRRIRRAFSQEALQTALEKAISAKLGESADPELDAFQARAASVAADVMMVKAGCGSGKTVLAFRRAQHSSVRGLVMTAPTTAVATQTYFDYGLYMGDSALLIHSRSAVDVELLQSPSEERAAGAADQQGVMEGYEALERLLSPVVFCTVDTVVGVLTNRRQSLALLPRLAVSQIVFDEAHLYDPVLFSHLLSFLRAFHIPALLMTASLPPSMQEAMVEAARGRRVEVMQGPHIREQLPRYNLMYLKREEEDTLVSTVKSAVLAGQKVLVVVNRVAWAVEWYERLAVVLPAAQISLLHSHFKYEDRVRIQEHIVRAFRTPGTGFCAVTTQICEVSFDVSADMLVSHIAPFPAIVQRLGRLNRRAKAGDPCGNALFLAPPDASPYTAQELEEGMRLFGWLMEHKGRGVSQQDLADVLMQSASSTTIPDVADGLTWLDLRTARFGDPVRRAGYTVTVITRSDWRQASTPTARLRKTLTLPMPRHRRLPRSIWRYCYIVEDDEVVYSPVLGGRWKDEPEPLGLCSQRAGNDPAAPRRTDWAGRELPYG
ncbi:CRISPR-associated helicase/endonuclease Cas3 [Alicyclobacillus cellulosilyticus]|uniref:CRISPR-associated helicase/endonuclease Cas3 n=1 Tax=Alicyclobacillus cellulosilyticus TaxID=1003997 RepID=A0A917NKP7_9BACL|nr:CRISPR-associated helicase/endonuclease Cas3 [Alicyclobacillus cellulosilyticus]